MAKYKWRDGMPRPKVSADAFGKFVDGLGVEGLSAREQAERVASAARNSPVKKLFNWDDKKAAHAYRVRQAQGYLGGLTLVRVNIAHGRSQSTKAFHIAHFEGRRSWVHHDRIMAEPDLRAEVISNARARLESLIDSFASAASLGNYIPRLRAIVGDMKSEVEAIQGAAVRVKTSPRSKPEPVTQHLIAAE